jgi:hypothetical protein
LAEDVGIPFYHDLLADADTQVSGAWISGSPSLGYVQGNPTVFIGYHDAGLGLLFDDDVLRVQASAGRNPLNERHLVAADNYFGLGAGDTYTIVWRIFPLASDNYYDFVNVVRDELALNYEIPNHLFIGRPNPNDWDDMSVAERTHFFEQLATPLLSSQPYRKASDGSKYAHGPDIWEDVSGGSVSFIEDCYLPKTAETGLGLKRLLYVDLFLSSQDDAAVLYSDARIIAPGGAHQRYADSDYLYCFFPTLANSWGQRMLDFKAEVVEGYGVEGVYLDTCNYVGSPWTYHEDYWDGYSFLVDRDEGAIESRIGSVALLSRDYRVAFVSDLLAEGRPVVANHPPVTNAFAALPIPHLAEIGELRYAPTAARTHFTSPVVLNTKYVPNDLTIFVSSLLHGALHYTYHEVEAFYAASDIYKKIYPFTPVALQAGTLIGENKIVTCKRGYFGWGDTATFEITCYDFDGYARPHDFQRVIVDGMAFAEITENDGLVVIERTAAP